MRIDGNAAAIVGDGDKTVGGQLDLDPVGVTGERLVHGIVDHLGEEVMQRFLVGAADIHARAAAYRLEAFQNLDMLCGIAGFSRRGARRSAATAAGPARRWPFLADIGEQVRRVGALVRFGCFSHAIFLNLTEDVCGIAPNADRPRIGQRICHADGVTMRPKTTFLRYALTLPGTASIWPPMMRSSNILLSMTIPATTRRRSDTARARVRA